MKKKIVGIITILVIATGGIFFVMNREATVEVDTIAVEEGHIAKYVEEIGVVKTERNANVYAVTAGRVTEVLVEVGDEVKRGDLLARMDTQPLSTQARELQARRDVITAQYREAMRTIDDEELEKLQLQLQDAEVRLQEAERNLNNNRQLYEAGAISQEVYRTTVADFEVQERNVEKVKLDIEIAQKPLSENIPAQFQAQLRQIDLQLEEINSRRGDFVVTAPIEGTLMIKVVEVGSYLQPGTHMMEIGDTKDLYVESDILVADIAKVKEGDSVIVTNKDLGILGLKGTIRKIHPQAFTSISDLGIEQKRIKVDIEIESSPQNLRPGYDLDIKIILEERANVLVIPENALFQQEGKDYVFINENDVAVLREVEKGIESQRRVEIIRGLQKGDIVILSPDDALEEGSAVKTNQ
ncbi:MAG: efflux RND transporter periplasmic adaptor subunit [Clostridiaceae bacterium]|nr:efflux RND transporter periplasmic adaptor subunit [Clostridiaceae bacterium]